MKTVVSVLVIVLAAFAASCFDNEASGVSESEFQQLLNRVATLEANAPGDKAFSSDASGASLGKAAASGRALGTALQFNGAPSGATEIGLRSPNGYLYAVNLVGSGGKTGPVNHEIFYEAAGCVGQGYIAAVSDYGAEQGYVFAVTASGGTSWNDAAQFYYVAAGTKGAGPINYASTRGSLEECSANSGTVPVAFAVLPNDAAVTGVESSAITLPITLQ